jgi:hypothetical protein
MIELNEIGESARFEHTGSERSDGRNGATLAASRRLEHWQFGADSRPRSDDSSGLHA